MTELDNAFEKILEWKARRMLNADYQTSVGVHSADGAFKVGAIDAMVYDLASLVGFNRKTAEHSNWASYAVRKTFLNKLRINSPQPQATPVPSEQSPDSTCSQ